jgi:hypothetical protein
VSSIMTHRDSKGVIDEIILLTEVSILLTWKPSQHQQEHLRATILRIIKYEFEDIPISEI